MISTKELYEKQKKRCYLGAVTAKDQNGGEDKRMGREGRKEMD